MEVAFHAARTADPEALLTYSECGLTGEDANSQRKRVAVLTLLRRLKARGGAGGCARNGGRAWGRTTALERG